MREEGLSVRASDGVALVSSRPTLQTGVNFGVETDWFSEAQAEKVERLLCEWKLWTEVGRAALERHERLQPHRWVSLSMIARLLDIASLLGHLSVGLPP